MNGNRETKKIDNTNTTTYNFTNNKLTSLSGNEIATATYDNNGNMTSWDQNSVLTDYKYDEANRLDTLIKPFNTQAYFYNSRHQRYKTENVGSTSSHFVYSASGLLLSEYRYTISWEADYIYLNGMPIAKVMVHYDEPIESPPPGDTSGGIQSLSLEGFGTQALGSGPGGPIDPPPTVPTEDVFYFHNNYLGTPVAITDDAQTIKWSTQHYPFGAKYNENVSTTNYIRFPGQWEDNNTDLHYNWHRFYRPDLGQYINPDPIGLAGGINMYSYVGGNPINYIDSFGLDRWRVSAFVWGGFSAEWGDDNGTSYFDITIGLGFGAGISYDPTASIPEHLRPNTDCGESGKTYLGLKGSASGSVTAGPIRGAIGVIGKYGFLDATHYIDPMKNSTTLERNAIDNNIEPFADGSISKPFWGLGFNISAYVGFNGGNSWK